MSRRPNRLIACAAVLILAACSSSGGGAPSVKDASAAELVGKALPIKADPRAGDALAQAEAAFTVALLKQLNSASGANVSTSPASLALVLSMLQNGASGTTRTQIQKALQTSGLTDAQQNAGWHALTSAWDAAKSVELSAANSAWLQKGFPVEHQFLDDLKTYYGTGVWQVDYAKHMSAALAAINKWTSLHTHGKITKLFDQLDPSTVLALADAVYFKAAWQDPFDPHNTSPGRFTISPGHSVTVKFMSTEHGSYPACDGDGYSAIELPYTGGRFAALAIMPTNGSLHDFTAALTAQRLTSIVAALHTQDVELAMPRFTTTSTLDVNSTLAKLGMPIAFSDQADFSRMTKESVTVSQVVQRVYLSVGEKGTEAAAVTGIGVTGTSAQQPPPLSIDLDHPFLFLIRDTTTGAILFASQINNPAAA